MEEFKRALVIYKKFTTYLTKINRRSIVQARVSNLA